MLKQINLIFITLVLFINNVLPKLTKRDKLTHIMDFRIIGGTEASIKDFPYMVSVQKASNHICGGSIISEKFILTAAHCLVQSQLFYWKVVDPFVLNIVAGQTILDIGSCQYRDVKKLHIHKSYNEEIVKNDIGLIEIFEPIIWTKYTKAVVLPSENTPSFDSYDFCETLGWGDTDPYETTLKLDRNNILQQVDLKPASHKECSQFFVRQPTLFDKTKICIISKGGKDACFGDSGGPIVCKGIQYGITSFGLGCAQVGLPGIFTDVLSFKDWIVNVMHGTEEEVSERDVGIERLKNKLRPPYLHDGLFRNKTVKIINNLIDKLIIFLFILIFIYD